MRTAAALVVLAALITTTAATELEANSFIDVSGIEGDAQTFTAGDLTIDLSFSGDEAERIVTFVVTKPGADPVTVSGYGAGAGYGALGVVDFDTTGARSVVVAIHSGGAHCCYDIQSVTPTAAGLVADHVGWRDGDLIDAEDLDGDGVYEIVLNDDRFNYHFDAYAMSFPPPMIMKATDGKVFEATTDDAYRPYLEAQFAYGKETCGEDPPALAFCAGSLAIAAQLGIYLEELPQILRIVSDGGRANGTYSFCTDDACEGEKSFETFAEAADYVLWEYGYLP